LILFSKGMLVMKMKKCIYII